MAQHDFSDLYEHYPEIIDDMEETFTSHQFILEIARRYQRLYVEALYAYRDTIREDRPAPFMAVHTILAQHLANYADLLTDKAPSIDIFGQPRTCGKWRKHSK